MCGHWLVFMRILRRAMQTCGRGDEHYWRLLRIGVWDPKDDRNVVFRFLVAYGNRASELQHLLGHPGIIDCTQQKHNGSACIRGQILWRGEMQRCTSVYALNAATEGCRAGHNRKSWTKSCFARGLLAAPFGSAWHK